MDKEKLIEILDMIRDKAYEYDFNEDYGSYGMKEYIVELHEIEDIIYDIIGLKGKDRYHWQTSL